MTHPVGQILDPTFDSRGVSIRLVTPALLRSPRALALPTFVAVGVIEFFEKREHHATSLGQLLDMLPHCLRHRVPQLDGQADLRQPFLPGSLLARNHQPTIDVNTRFCLRE